MHADDLKICAILLIYVLKTDAIEIASNKAQPVLTLISSRRFVSGYISGVKKPGANKVENNLSIPSREVENMWVHSIKYLDPRPYFNHYQHGVLTSLAHAVKLMSVNNVILCLICSWCRPVNLLYFRIDRGLVAVTYVATFQVVFLLILGGLDLGITTNSASGARFVACKSR